MKNEDVSVFKIREGEEAVDTASPGNNRTSVIYTFGRGESNFTPRVITDEKSPAAFAQVVEVEGSKPKYKAKFSADGRLFDPKGFNQGQEYKTRHGEPMVKFKDVNKEVFEFYIKYLATGNPAWLLNAERKVIS